MRFSNEAKFCLASVYEVDMGNTLLYLYIIYVHINTSIPLGLPIGKNLSIFGDRINLKRKEIGDRLRPILTTIITTIMGVISLALSDRTRFPLASAIGFGLVASTLIALLVIPCLYLLLTPNKSRVEVA